VAAAAKEAAAMLDERWSKMSVGMTSESVAGGNPNFWVEKLRTDLQF
jgi:hypothetical protein